jgi:polyisoprenoid-binding protein YceI
MNLLPVLILATAATAPQRELTVQPSQSKISLQVIHKLHKVHGSSHRVEGKARLFPDGRAQVEVEVPSESFTTGNVQRDAHMKESVEAAKNPEVTLKAVGEGVTMPKSFPATVQKTFKGQLDLRGVKHELEVPVQITFESPDRVHAKSTFHVSLDQYQVPRPSLMFVKIEDDLEIDADVTFAR